MVANRLSRLAATLESLTIYDALPMVILGQAHDMQLMENAAFPPRPVRGIGS
ncbi:hypothetical protein KHC17_26085 (plasmid) [Agrobacterium salinitolerans]|uniref:hypothetical protein n=1 Tax=Agrobacterium salinitolerans TaxID=1183413 RepID=UPI001C2208AF|nr:hypothetical protein [Agrobacterium salinitolerans]QXC52647.1 hypothetical protein KHC17_26085 [Agrobacterium salinitolerans]